MKQAGPKVLIADDESAITAGLSAILSDEGYTWRSRRDGQSALERLTEERYGVVLADLKMPKLDGLALLRELQPSRSPPSDHHHRSRHRSTRRCRRCSRVHTTTSRSRSTPRS